MDSSLKLPKPDTLDLGLQGVDEGRRDISPAALDVLRGAKRFIRQLGYGAMEEARLTNGRRADLMALSAKGDIIIIEVKSCLADWQADHKWQDYLPFCDRFYIAIDCDFPLHILEQDLKPTPEAGIIMADAHGADIVKECLARKLHPSRRKAVVTRFAYGAGRRLLRQGA